MCMLSCFSCVQLSATPWAIDCQAPLSRGFPRHECWSGLPCPPPGDLHVSGIKPMSLISPVLAGRGFPGVSDSKESACKAEDLGLGRFPGEGNGYPLQHSCLENSMDRGVWWTTYSPWGCKGSDISERLSLPLSLLLGPLWLISAVKDWRTWKWLKSAC